MLVSTNRSESDRDSRMPGYSAIVPKSWRIVPASGCASTVWQRLVILVIALFCGAGEVAANDAASEEFFEKRIRPVLVKSCFSCHGGAKVSGGLRVDSRAALIQGGESGKAIDLANPEQSLLLQAIRRGDDVAAMPPDQPLDARSVADLTAWVKVGSPWPATTAKFEAATHWSLRPITNPPAPPVKNSPWVRTSIDPYILAPLEAAGLAPASPADRRTLLRRLTYDLTGLPPTAEEVAAFESDQASNAYETAVNRLLDSRHYGEHWGRHWLDVVRYADTAGENSDHPLPHAWQYRNWVVDAFNRDLPYDEFLRRQIAGDLLSDDSRRPEDATDADQRKTDRIVATGYLAIARRFGHDIDKDMHLTLEDTIDTLGKSVLGLTLGCCRCHDHKYDPISTRDYYGLYGIFDSTRFAFPGCEPKQQPRDLVPLPLAADQQERVKTIDAEVAVLDKQLAQWAADQAGVAKQLKEQAAVSTTRLAGADVGEGQSVEIVAAPERSLSKVAVKTGDVLLLTILPRGNHGADSTLVEWEIAEVAAAGAGPATPQRWSVQDLVSTLPTGNPHPDSQGRANVWCFLDLRDGPHLLAESLQEINGRKELKAWRNGDTPSVFVNSSDQPVKVWTELPPRSFFAHPGEKGPVGVAWISPVDGEVAVKGRVADAHPAALDGVAYALDHIAAKDYGAALTRIGDSRRRSTEATARRAELLQSRPMVPVAYAVTEGMPHHARLHKRGEPTDLGDEVPRKFPDALGGYKVEQTAGSGRLELARWLTDPRNPLTARVIANRVWQWHFGRGIVATPNDFGVRGAPPTHPELLDHLASVLTESGWSLKQLHRRIVLSAAYQQSSISSEFTGRYDSFPRRRLSAEELRDTLLAVSGELDRQPGGPHPFPPESTWSFSQHGPFAADYETMKRSVYVMQKRNRRIPFFALFDGPDPNASTPTRDVTTVPTQALFFLNDPFLHARADRFALRVVESASNDDERLDWASKQVLGRILSAEERADAAEFRQAYFASLDGQAARRELTVWQAYARVLLGSNEVLHVD